MKAKILNVFVMMMLLLCATAQAQIQSGSELIYSNAFNTWPAGLPYTSVYQTSPTYTTSTNLDGGSASAVWICTYTNPTASFNNPGASVPAANGGYGSGTVYLNGDISTNQGCALLPLTVQTNTVYILQASVTLPLSMGTEVEMGFTVTNTSQYNFDAIGDCRFNDSPPNGYAWDYIRVNQNSELFAGSKTGGGNTSGGDRTPTAGTYTLETILSTLSNTNTFSITNALGHGATNCWIAYSYVNGNQVGTNVLYQATAAGTPTLSFGYCGLGSAGFSIGGNPSGIQWNYFTVSTPLAPMITQQPASGSVNQGSAYTNTVVTLVDTNGGALFYQWYTNGVPLSNGGNISGATNASLMLNPVLPVDVGTNYYVVVTNIYGAVTSSPASLAVFTAPIFANLNPITYSNPMTLYGGTNNGVTMYLGSSPSFSAFATGVQPITYYWLTNGVAAGGANGTSFSYANCQWNSPTNFSCIASNSLGTATNNWPVVYLAAPTNPFPQAVLAANPLAYWRLNEPDDGSQLNNGDICHDYQSGNNGIYTNTVLGNSGYSSGFNPVTDPTETSALFGEYGSSCDANSIGTNLDFSSYSNAEFTVAIWANGGPASTETANGGMLTKGYFSGEEYDLDIAPGTLAARFETHNAAAIPVNANSTLLLAGDPKWHYIVGVCDESNGVVSIYVDGVLEGTASITPGSGIVNSATTPVMIGARSMNAADNGSQQFLGYLDDAAVYGYAMNQSQIISQYQAAGGVFVPYLEFLAPLPVTNVVYQTNATITIPATAYGTPPIGYYWTNLTAGGVITAGTTNVYADLNATLTVQDVNGSLNGDVLELVVTNAGGSTNWIVNDLSVLTNPPPAMALGYTNAIIYSNSFTADLLTIGGTGPTAFNDLFGTNDWICTYSNSAPGSGTVYANGTLGTNAGNVVVPFTPETGYIYTMIGSLTLPATTPNWISMGFEQAATPPANTQANGRFTDSPYNGYAWMYVQSSSAQATFEPGPRTGPPNGISLNGSVTLSGTNILQIVLNTVTNNGWVASASINGVGIATNYYNSTLPIAYAGIGQNAFSTTPPTGIQWNYWALTAQAVSVPPYLLVSPPTNNIVLTNATITLPATAYGSAPMGYYWINNATVIASGTTNNMAPLPADLTIPSTSLSAGQLELVVTNAYGTNITSITLVSPVNTTPVPIRPTLTNGMLYLTWPVDHTGWQLQAQTNPVSVGINNNWANYNPSTSTNQVVIPINLTNGTVFYRLIYTP